jgi:hypothetical protein
MYSTREIIHDQNAENIKNVILLSRVLSARGNNKRGFSGFGNSIYWTLPVVTTVIHFTTLQHT